MKTHVPNKKYVKVYETTYGCQTYYFVILFLEDTSTGYVTKQSHTFLHTILDPHVKRVSCTSCLYTPYFTM